VRAIGAELRPSDRAEQCGDETRFDYLKKPFLGQVKYRCMKFSNRFSSRRRCEASNELPDRPNGNERADSNILAAQA